MDLSDSVLDHLRHVAALPDLTGTRYELESEIGRGGMGVVYAARDRELDRRVALKVLDLALAGEAQLIARLEHPAIVPIYETGTLPDGRAFYAMKLVSGARLDRYVAGVSSLAERLGVIRRVGEALAFAHARGVIHRDLKPQNVMVGEFGEVYVMDWGVDAVAGTPGFRAPDARLDQRSDIYALGALVAFRVSRTCAARPARHRRQSHERGSCRPLSRCRRRFWRISSASRKGWPWRRGPNPGGIDCGRFGSRNAVLLWLLAAYAGVKFLLFFLRNL